MKELVFKIKKYVGIMMYMQKIDLMNRMAYQVNFLVQAMTVGLQMVFSLIFIKILFVSNKSIVGWGFNEALLVVGTYMIIEGVMWTLCAYISALDRNIKDGTLDGILLRPVDAQFLISVWRGDVEDFVRIVSGVGVVAFALKNISFAAGELILNLALYFLLVLCALIITYSLNLFLRSISFWTIEGGALFSLGMAVTRITQYPSDIFYGKTAKFLTTFIIPLAFMATVPAKVLAYGFDWKLVLLAFMLAFIFFFVSRQFFHFALRHYESGSS